MGQAPPANSLQRSAVLAAVALIHGAVVSSDGAARRSVCILGDRLANGAAPASPEVDLRDHLILPGLVNAHDHLQLNSIPPLPGARIFENSYQWIAALAPRLGTGPIRAATNVAIGDRCWQGGLKNLLSGATTVAHHDPWDPVFDDQHFPVNVLRRFGWCHSLGLAPARRGALGRLAGRLLGRRSRSGLGPYGPGVIESFLSTDPDRPWIIHLAEGRDGMANRELGELANLGCLAKNTVIVHGVGLLREDIQEIIRREAAVVWCPSSNLSILGETLDPRPLFEAGRLAVGSDSRLSGARDLLADLSLAVTHGGLLPSDLFCLATIYGARALRLPEVGGVDPGQRADLVVVRDAGGDPREVLFRLERRDIRAVVRGGLPVVADPDLAGWFEAAGVEAVTGRLDGRPKIFAKMIANPSATRLEPGLEISA